MVKIHRERFTELAAHRGGERVLNIIFVHGLRGHPRSTWEDTKHKVFGPKVFWPEQFLAPDLPQARIWTYGYNANVTGFFAANNKNSILQHGEDLVIRLENDIDNKDPIIFVAHSLGGIIVKHALHESKECRNRTKLIIFLGTPHRGSEHADWAKIAANLMSVILDSNKTLVDNLNVNSEVLDSIHERFLRIVRGDEIKIHSFFEARGMSSFKLFSGKVVNDVSSKLDLPKPFETVESLDANHMQMARCTSRDDPNFRAILHVLKLFIQIPATKELPATACANILSQSQEHIRMSRQSHWVVSFGRNESFVGRESILHQLLKRIPPSANEDDCQLTAIEGLGGVGKTQLALEAAFRVRDKHPDCSVFWVPAVDIGSFENAYREIGCKLKIDRIDEDAVDVKRLVKTALSQENVGTWLLVIDNADDTDFFFGDQRIIDYLPFSRMGSILFTTRNHEAVVRLDIPTPGIIEAAQMSGDEALELLQKNLKEGQLGSYESTTMLLVFLANLPLAIRQASAYMAKTGMSTKKYLDYCQASDEKQVELLSKDFEDRGRYKESVNAVAATWLISFKLISRDSPLAARYLEFICFFAEKDIPTSLLPPFDDELKAEEAMGTLKAYAFVMQREGRNTFDIHRLVRLAMQNWLLVKGKKNLRVAQVVERMVNIYPFPEHQNRDIWIPYLPHVQAVLNVRRFFIDPLGIGRLLFLVGTSLHELVKYREAEDMLRSAVNLTKQVQGLEDEMTVSCMSNLALVLQEQDKCEEAEQLHRQLLGLREKLLGRDNKFAITHMINLALVLKDQMKYEEAEKLSREALELSAKIIGEENPKTLKYTNNLAAILTDKGSLEEAEKLHRRELMQREKILGKEHPDTLMSMGNVAGVLSLQGNHEEAEQLHWQTLKLQEKILGGKHPMSLNNSDNLTSALRSQEKYTDAERLSRQVLQVKEEIFGREHQSTLITLHSLAIALNKQEKHKEAEQILWQTLELEKRRGYKIPKAITTLVCALSSQGKYDDAEQICRHALEVAEENPDLGNSTTAFCREYMEAFETKGRVNLPEASIK